MYWVWAFPYYGFSYLVRRMFLAHVYPSLSKGKPSMIALTLGTSSSFKYENLATWPMSDLSISTSNCPQDLCQSRCIPWNFIITSLGSLTFGLPGSLPFSTVFTSNFFLMSKSRFLPFSWVFLASCSLNFCFSSSSCLTTSRTCPTVLQCPNFNL